MAASEAAVTAVMETLGCHAGTAICLTHRDYLRRDRARGCPVAVAAADARDAFRAAYSHSVKRLSTTQAVFNLAYLQDELAAALGMEL